VALRLEQRSAARTSRFRFGRTPQIPSPFGGSHFASLTPQFFDGRLPPSSGQVSLVGRPAQKKIATDLGISQRTVQSHRASITKKMGAKSLPVLARLALAAASDLADKIVTEP